MPSILGSMLLNDRIVERFMKPEELKEFERLFVREDDYQTGVFRFDGFIEPYEVVSFVNLLLKKREIEIFEKVVARLSVEVMETNLQGGKDLYNDGHIHGVRRAIYLINSEFRGVKDE